MLLDIFLSPFQLHFLLLHLVSSPGKLTYGRWHQPGSLALLPLVGFGNWDSLVGQGEGRQRVRDIYSYSSPIFFCRVMEVSHISLLNAQVLLSVQPSLSGY